jgi:hypothetical protein
MEKDKNQRVKLEDCVGHTLICDDGVARLVYSIVHSVRFRHLAVINEDDPESKMGHHINLLSLSAQMLGSPMPTKEQLESFKRMCADMHWDNSVGKTWTESNGIVRPNIIH